VFFTNNLDARLIHPDEWNEAHNLVVVSPFHLSLEEPGKVLPTFRDSGQTSLFAATLEAMDQIPEIPKDPFIFEIGRDGPKNLSIPAQKRDTLEYLYRSGEKEMAHQSASTEDPDLSQYFLGIGCFIASGIFLVAWTWFVSRVPGASFKTKAQKGDKVRKNECLESGDGYLETA
jgi:hypothetical protein